MLFLNHFFETFKNEYGYTVLSLRNPDDKTLDALIKQHGARSNRKFTNEDGEEKWIVNAFLDINMFTGASTLKVTVSDTEVINRKPFDTDTFDDRIGWKKYDKRRRRF